jgi:hypothetical protein
VELSSTTSAMIGRGEAALGTARRGCCNRGFDMPFHLHTSIAPAVQQQCRKHCTSKWVAMGASGALQEAPVVLDFSIVACMHSVDH